MVDYYSCKMSGSDEEFEPQMQTGMSKAELRRSNKPIMEKRRRARINQCLDELKSLILEAMKKDPTRHSKLEKADILEMTVKHLQSMQRQQISTAVSTDPAVLTKFRSGFSECASEVSRYVSHLENVDPTVKTRLTSHLSNCMNNLQQSSPFYNHYVPYMPERLYPEVKVGFQADAQSVGGGDENNNNGSSARIQMPGNVQLIPSRLANGELALLVPPSANFSGFFPPTPGAADSAAAGSRLGQPSAFTAVHRSHSPLLSPSTSTSSYDDTQPGCLSPLAAHFKMPERSASPKGFCSPPPGDTQKPQISSSSDPSSPGPAKRPAAPGQDDGPDSYSLRQPLSVITDKYNRTIELPKRSEPSLKRHHPDGLLLAISDKRPRYQEPASTSSSLLPSTSSSCLSPTTVKIKQEYHGCQDDVACDKASGVESSATTATTATTTTSSTTNGDMWRPW